ncbi:glycoside hydrolase family 12 protein [Viridothelium virens]|uniref:Glycoside hydrolase family 12 protein n=1 Tax=Viridothelium virens TaxID=1048519 RepID=A0A6A6H0J7_VIRVR|nr:glycoside hydrolase family 12 protein [Viridothelium virens]
MQPSTLLTLASAAALAIAAPTKTIDKRAAQCGQWDSVKTGSYTLYQDLWGESSGTGSQCSEVNSFSGNTIGWDTTWSWSGGAGQVKSYANVQVTNTAALSSVSSIQSTWKWSYTGSNIIADVAYDIFTGASAGSSAQYEIMIWLGALGGAGPISSTGSPVSTPTIDGVTWKLYSGPNGATTVYSFVAESQQTSFSGDLKQFFTYLSTNEGYSLSQHLISIGAGTEPFSGSNAKLTTTAYSVSIAT